MTAKVSMVVAASLLFASASQAAAPLQVIQPGDSAMSCAALAAEINGLSARVAKAEQRAASSEKFKGFGAAALRAATPMLDTVVSETGGGTMAAASMARSALQGSSGGYGGYGPPQPSRAQPPAQSLEQMRLQRLNSLHAGKSC